MRVVDHILWWGTSPLIGVEERFSLRGWRIVENQAPEALEAAFLSVTRLAILNYPVADDLAAAVYQQLPLLIMHGVLLLIVGGDATKIRGTTLPGIDAAYPWDEGVRFVPNLKGVHFDTVVCCHPGRRWQGFELQQKGRFEKLGTEDELLVRRAFQEAEEVHLRILSGGLSGSRVFMAHEKRSGKDTSIAHWRLPRLVKLGDRAEVSREIKAMEDVSPFVPFELRPNLEISIQGFRRAMYVADFVELSESLLAAARNGRGEAAISNLFYRTLGRWRDRGRQCAMVYGSLTEAAERLDMMHPRKIQKVYLESLRIKEAQVAAAWEKLASFQFKYRAATIHGDLHGQNVRVRGDDAILIDLGGVRGDTLPGREAPLCFDVAMLEVALVFAYQEKEDKKDDEFEQPEWKAEIAPFYELHAITNSPSIDAPPNPESWLFGCLQRIRAFGIYDQSSAYEYPIALVIALWRWCKFSPSKEADRGRRVVALELGYRLAEEIVRKRDAEG
jgi:hypothetical protein